MARAFEIEDIRIKLEKQQRITRQEARFLWLNASDEQLQSLASIVRDRFHVSDKATYMLMRIINYTNICVAKCDYCSFYRLPKEEGAYLRSKEYIYSKIDELLALGGELFAFNGGFNPELKIDYYTDLFSLDSQSLRRIKSNSTQ